MRNIKLHLVNGVVEKGKRHQPTSRYIGRGGGGKTIKPKEKKGAYDQYLK
jgi:hypothetical protein